MLVDHRIDNIPQPTPGVVLNEHLIPLIAGWVLRRTPPSEIRVNWSVTHVARKATYQVTLYARIIISEGTILD
jgi:hypothetical protein